MVVIQKKLKVQEIEETIVKKLDNRFKLQLNGSCNPACVVQGEKYRITVLTSRMLRLEYSEDGEFEDRPTQVVWNRNFDSPEFTVSDRENRLEIDTEYLHLVYDKKEFTPNHLYIDVKYAFTNYGGRWYYGRTDYGDPPRTHTLKGTARTLDRCSGMWYEGANVLERMRTWGNDNNRDDGDVNLGMGLCDSSGRTFFDDSKSLIIDEDGWVHPRKMGCTDVYFFGYGRDYFGAIHDFYRLSGPVPMLPKYVLGNWWSRYWKYTEESYMELLTRFEEMKIPFSVVVMDMDWHLVDIPKHFGRGWTGYTWNKEFFPDPKRFLDWLHEHNYRITLNLHPADGVRAFEEQYEDMAKAMGIDPDSGYPVAFDFTNIQFIEAYFKYLHHPNEEQGVDFWWMDWQQGNVSAVEGMDPMWMLNHYHHYDLKKEDKRAVMLSRYSGLGSHRYPMGFSGDTIVSWDTLEYQPYFTSTAANVGYTWWSHDIGGHMKGIKDNQLYIRWLQYGVFSPINRLHSNKDPFCGKEPWRYPKPYDEIAAETLRLRHRLLPYIYTMNYQCHEDMVPVVVPAYYHHPMMMGSYKYRNEYYFGTELLVQPMVHPTDRETGYTSEKSWIPDGIWTDFYDGTVYNGGAKGRTVVLNRTIEHQCVLAKAGAIVPMAVLNEQLSGCINDIENPETLEIYVYPGGNNTYVLFEDSGDGFSYEKGVCLHTEMKLQWENGRAVFTVKPHGDLSVIPEHRTYVIHFRGFSDPEKIQVSEEYEKFYDKKTRTLTLKLMGKESGREISVELKASSESEEEQQGNLIHSNSDRVDRVFDFLDSAQGTVELKNQIFNAVKNADSVEQMMSSLLGLEMSESWRNVLTELIVH